MAAKSFRVVKVAGGLEHPWAMVFLPDGRALVSERPGRLVGVGIMTDTDNTGGKIEAFYGDIELRSAS